MYIKKLSCDACKVNSVCKDCFSELGASTKDITRGTGAASEKNDQVSGVYDNSDSGVVISLITELNAEPLT